MADTDLSTDGEDEEEEELGMVIQTRAGKTAQLVEENNKLEQEVCRRFETAGLSSVNYDWQPGKLVFFDEMKLDFDPEARFEYLKKITLQQCEASTFSASTEPRSAPEETDSEGQAAGVLE